MATLPGFFMSVNIGESTLIDPGDDYDVSGLTFAVVMHEHSDAPQYRWTTWTLDADSLLLYQPGDAPGYVVVGNAGHLYVLTEGIKTEDGKAVPIVYTSGPLPELDDQGTTAIVHKQFHSVWWEVVTPPAGDGYVVTVKLVDVNDTTNFIERIVLQDSTRMNINMYLECRQAYLSIRTITGRDFNVTNYGYSYQNVPQYERTARR